VERSCPQGLEGNLAKVFFNFALGEVHGIAEEPQQVRELASSSSARERQPDRHSLPQKGCQDD